MIRYGNVHATSPHPGVVYAIEPAAALASLRAVIQSTSLFKRAEKRRNPAPPHMTIAEFVSLERSLELATELAGKVREGEWLCGQIEYAVPNAAFRFQRVLPLGLG